MQIEVDDVIVERIMKTEMLRMIDMVKINIKQWKKTRKRESYQQEDLADSEKILPHLEAVYDYYDYLGGNIK